MVMHYILNHTRFSQRQMARDLEIPHGEQISTFVNWLEELRFVRKTYETKRGTPNYELISRIDLLNFYSRYRDMSKELFGIYDIGSDALEVMRFLNKHKSIMCLTTALQFYDEYVRDPTIHAYVPDRKLIDEINSQAKGTIKVILYNYEYPDIIQVKENFKITSPARTIMDLFCNNMAYTAEHFIQNVWND